MKPKVIIGILVIAAGIALSAVNFVQSNVEYGDFAAAASTGKKIQVKGTWVQNMDSRFDSDRAEFTFYLKDDNNKTMRVVLDGAKPNNFELAESIVAKGRMNGDHFEASEVLTKCPSKYEGNAEAVKKTMQP